MLEISLERGVAGESECRWLEILKERVQKIFETRVCNAFIVILVRYYQVTTIFVLSHADQVTDGMYDINEIVRVPAELWERLRTKLAEEEPNLQIYDMRSG
jgi:hypothetical protein